MHKVTNRWPHQDSIKIEWNLGKRCNYDCSYCPAAIHDNSSAHTNIAVLKATVDQLVAIGKPIRLSFTGGEPCVHPDFSKLLWYCRERGIQWISVTTNGTRKPNWYLAQPVDQYVFSLHFEYDWESAVHTIISVASTKVMSTMVNVMAHHDRMSDVRQAAGLLTNQGVPHGIRRIRWTEEHDLFDDNKYTEPDLEWIKASDSTVKGNTVIDGETIMHANDVIKLHLNKFAGWSCSAGLESLMINWDGDVHRATCRVGGSLGNIYSRSFTVPTAPITCTRTWCTCAADIPITKSLTEPTIYNR
jgi:MoaA/NifB/PqqE/SkfB family radical SAM enzyme